VLVQVNEAGSHHQPGSVNHAAAAQRGRCDTDDLAVADADVADGIEPGFRIDLKNGCARDDAVVNIRTQSQLHTRRPDTGFYFTYTNCSC